MTRLSTPNTWHLDQIGLTAARANGIGRGQGVTVAVVDSCIDGDHPDLDGKVVEYRAVYDNRIEPVADWMLIGDSCEHGTFVAGLIAGEQTGVAPDAKLINYVFCQTMTKRRSATFNQILEVLAEVAKRADEIRLLNLSYAGLSLEIRSHPSNKAILDKLGERFDELHRYNVLAVIAVGNVSDSGNPPNVPSANGPGQTTLIVGASDQNGQHSRISRYGRHRAADGSDHDAPDLLAPGEDVCSCYHYSTEYIIDSGTSFATAIVTGVAALEVERQPGQTAVDLRQTLMARCMLIADCDLERQGRGLIQVR
jgi:subtilisin family serine protease